MPNFNIPKSIIGVLVFSAVLIGLLTWFAEHGINKEPDLLLNKNGEIEELGGPLTAEERKVKQVAIINNMNPIAVLNTNKGIIKLELFGEDMPITVSNFVTLAEEGFYDQTKFHRVIDGFMIQGGDPNSKSNDATNYGTGGPGYTIEDEFTEGELLTNVRGTIAMANTGQPNSGGSQFFINLVDNTPLDFDKEPFSSKHPVFGRVIEGMDIVDAIAKSEVGQRDVPVDPIVIESVVIE